MDSSLIQLLARGGIDEKYIGNDNSFFLDDFNLPKKSYKQYDAEKSQIMKFDDSLNIKLDYKHHYLTENYIKVKIPYFQMFKNTVSLSSSDSDYVINKIIYDNHDTYLFIINDKYYLIPEFLLKSNINYEIEKMLFSNIKEYFNSTLEYYISDNEYIYFASFERLNFISDLIPLFLTFNDLYNKYYLDLINNNLSNKQLNMPLLTSTTFNKYLENIVNNNLFNTYQNLNHNDILTKYYNLNQEEVEYFINHYFNNKPIENYDYDSYRAYEYYNINNYEYELNNYIEDTIVKNSIILHYIINNLYTNNYNTFTFYKKYLTSTVNYEYQINITNSDIEDIDTLGGNLVSKYYPKYTLKVETDLLSEYYNLPVLFKRLPFNFTSDMSFRTLTYKNGTYQVSDNIYTLTIDDNNTYEETTITLLVTTDNTKNDANIDTILTDNNINTEFVNNIKTNLGNLDYNFNINILLFNKFKELYFGVEQFVKTYLYNLSLTQEQIKDIFIGLKVYEDKFKKIFTEINFITNNDFLQEYNTLLTNYPDIYKINTLPQDLYNIYLLCLNDFKNEISSSSIFSDTTFIDIYFNKIVSYFYNRFIKVSNIDNSITSSFNGLMFYFNIENKFYINKQFLRDSFEELFNKKSFIGYSQEVPELKFSHNIIKENVNEFYDNTNFVDNNISYCFNDFTIKNTYDFSSEYVNFTFSSNKIILSKKYFNTFYYKDNLTKFSVILINQNKELNVIEYILDDSNITLIFSTTISSQPIKLNEFIYSSIPLVHFSTTNNVLKNFADYSQNNLPMNTLSTTDTDLVGLKNNTIRYEIYNKYNIVNKFIDLNNIYFDEEYDENYNYFMYFIKDNKIDITFKLRFILSEDFENISYSQAMSNINNMIISMSDKLNIDKELILFKNLIIGKTESSHIDYYFNIKKNITLNYLNSKISDLSISILYYITLSTSDTISLTLDSIDEIETNTSYTKIILEDNGIGYKIKDMNNSSILTIDYNDYDYIYIDVIKLPITKDLVINDSDCIYEMSNTYPFIFLDKTSTIYTDNSDLFSTLNTIYNNDNVIKIVDITSTYIKLQVIGDITIGSSINIEIFNNSYLPNFYDYTTKSSTDLSIIGDFMFQKPMILKIYNKSDEVPVYLFYNINNHKNSIYYENTTYYINEKQIYELYKINSNQLNRDVSTGNKYSTVYDSQTLKQYDSNILNNMLSIYDNQFNNDYKSLVIDIIEKSYIKYIDCHKNILNSIKKTNNYGLTISKIYNAVEELNEFKSINGNTKYNINLENYNLFEYDYYSIYAFTLYNHTNFDKTINNDKILITNLNSKYNISKQVINYPWVSYSVQNKINSNVNKFLLNFSKVIKNQIEYCKNNNVIDEIINNNLETESTNIGKENDFRSKYINKVYDYDTTNIKLLNNDIHSDYISKNINTTTLEFKDIDDYVTENTYVESYYNNKKIPVKYENNSYITKKDTMLNKSTDNIVYLEEKINNDNNYKNIGYIRINDNKIVIKNLIDSDYKYVVLNNKVYNYPINDKKYKFYVNGTSSSGPSKGITGYFYPLSTVSFGNDHAHTFEEFPGITFYMPKDIVNHGLITSESSSEPTDYFNYQDIQYITFNSINGIYGNCKAITKSSSSVDLSLTNTYLFYSKISSLVLSTYLDSNKKYYFKVNDYYAYGKYNGEYIEFISIRELTFNENNIIYYEEITLDDSDIFTNVLNNNFNSNLSLPYNNNFTIPTFIILETGFYNYYCNQDTTFNTYDSYIVDFNNDSVDYPQNYNIYINILGNTLFNFNKSSDVLNVTIYKSTEVSLPPMKVSNIIIPYDSINEIDWINKGGYLKINDTDYSINNLDSIIENNGNYLCYYVNNTSIPSNNYYPDIYQKKITVNSNITLNPYKKTLAISTIDIFQEIDIEDVIEVNNVKYQLSKIIDTSNITTLDIDYLRTDIIDLVIKDSSDNKYFRQIYYVNDSNYFNYTYYSSLSAEIDNMVIISTSDLSGDTIFLSKITFSSSHSSETLQLTSSNNDITIEKIDNLNYNINLANNGNLVQEKEYIVYLNISNGDKEEIIIFRSIISDTYFTDSLSYNSEKLKEPIYITVDTTKYIDIPSSYTIYTYDSFYLNKESDTKLSTKETTTFDNFTIYGNKYIQFDEISSNQFVIEDENNKNKLIQGNYNNWEYVDNVTVITIDNNSTIENDTLKSYFKDKYLPIVLVSKDIVYFREIIDIIDNKLKLSESVDITEADIYMYPYLPVYIDCNVNLEYFNQNYHIHTDNSNGMVFERNEIIKFGKNVLQIMDFSILKQSYMCSLLSSNFEYFDGSGYYSFGKINNYYEKNNYLKSNHINKLFRYLPYTDMLYGDYYIEDNEMKIYRGTEDFTVNNIFRNINGSHIFLYYYNGVFYYNIHRVNLKEEMRLYYNNKQFIVKTITGNKFTFTNTDSITFTNYMKYTIYVPNHIFEATSILITDYTASNIKNGFLLYENKFYTISNYKTSIQSLYGNVLLYNVDEVNIYYDFNNPYIFTSIDDSFNNTYTPLRLKMNINTDDDIYFYNSLYSDISFKYCYFQRILIDGVFFNVTRIESDKIYINNKESNFKLKVKSDYYEVLISAFNINNNYIVSNNYELNDCLTYNYPVFKKDNSNMNILFYNNNNTNNYSYNYNEENLTSQIKNNEFIYLTQSDKLNEIRNISEIWDNMNRQFFTDNYIRLNEENYGDDTYSIYLKEDELNLNTMDNVLIEEIYGSEKYLHIVNIEVINNFMKIKDNYKFEELDESVFYLHKVIPIRITKNNYIQILKPDVYSIRELNDNSNIINYKVYLRITFDTKPIYNKTTNLWKYNITIHSDLNLEYISYLYFDNYNGDTITLTLVNEGTTYNVDYYVTSEYLFTENDKTTHFYYNTTNYVKSIEYSTLTTKEEYDLSKSTMEKLITNNNINDYKILNKCVLNNTNDNYYFSLVGNNSSNINIGKIEGTYYFNNTNKINHFELTSNNTYNLVLDFALFDLDNGDTTKNYIYYKNQELNDYYYLKPKEISPSLPSMIKILNNKDIDIKLILNYLKPWKDWSLLSLSNDSDFKQYIKNYVINYNGTNITYTLNTNSYFTNSEVNNIQTFLENTYEYKSHYYSTLTELHSLESFLLTQIALLINSEYFWNNIETVITIIVKNFKSTNDWVYYNNTIMIDYGSEKEIDKYPSLFENGYRKYYLSDDITITNNNTVSISRNISIINDNLELFLSKAGYNMNGIRIDTIIELLKDISVNRLKIMDKDNTYLNHNYPSIMKFLINRQFSKYIDDDTNGLNNLNNDFYQIKYSQSVSNIQSGQYIDNMFNVKYFGLNSHGKIHINGFGSLDTKYILNIYENGDLYNTNNNNANNLITDPIFYYKINFDDNTSQILTSSSEYSIEYTGSNYKETDNKINKLNISKPEIYSDSIIFYSGELIKDKDIIVNVKDEYTIESFEYYGSLYEMSISSLTKITKDSEVYFNDFNKVKLLEITSTKIKVLSDKNIDSLYNLRIIDLCKVISTSQESSLTYLTLSSNISGIFIVNNTYININGNSYMLYLEDNNYYIDALITIKNNRLYKVTRNIDITENEVKSLYVADITIDKDLEHYFYYNQTDNNLDEVNFTSDKLHIMDIDLLTKSKLRIYYHMNNLTIGDTIIHSYNIRQSNYYNINTITNMNKYLYDLDIDLSGKTKDNITLTIGDYTGEIVDNNINNMSFYLSSFYTPIILNKLTLNIKYTYNLQNISSIGNIIYATIPSDFIYNSGYNYYINNININTNITASITVTNKLVIIIDDINDIEDISDITLIEERVLNTGKFNITKPVFNNLIQLDLTNNYNPQNKSNNFNNYISIFDKNISGGMFNYTYYYNLSITSSDINFTDYMYLVYNDKTYKVRIIMIQQDSNDYNIKIGTNDLFEINTQVVVYTEDANNSFTVSLSIDNMNLIKTEYYKNIDNNTIQLYVNNNLSGYDKDANITENDYIMFTKYSDISMNNNSYKNVGFNKVTDNNVSTQTIVKEYTDVKFVEDVAYKFFKLIDFSINNKTIEKLDYDCLKLLFSFYYERHININDIHKIKKVGDYYEFDLLLPFFFTRRYSDALPLYMLDSEDIKIKFQTEKLKNLIDATQYSDYKVDREVKPIIEYNYAYNNMNVRDLEMIDRQLIETMYIYQTIILNKPIEYNVVKIQSRIKEFFIAIKNKVVKTTYEYDSWLSLYLTNYEKYKNSNKNSTSIYEIEDYYIFRLADDEVKNNSNRVTQIKNHPLLKNYDVKYVIYLDEKYLDYINENLNNLTIPFSNKITILSLYFNNIYKNNKVETKVDLINHIQFELNGLALKSAKFRYYGNLLPYYNGDNLDDDYLLYNVSFNALEEQPTGFFCCSDDMYFGIKTVLNVADEPVFIKLLTKEYKYLKFNDIHE
jgi:hypothetical protein